MTTRKVVVDPVIPRFCAQSGASLPLAWELAWSEPVSETVVRLVPPRVPQALGRGPWPRALHPDTELSLEDV